MKLLCENNRCEFTRDMLAELENINRFTQQALYYALKGDDSGSYTEKTTASGKSGWRMWCMGRLRTTNIFFARAALR